MTFQIFKQFAAIVVFVFVGVVNIKAQQPSADDMLNLVANMRHKQKTFWRKPKRPSTRWKK